MKYIINILLVFIMMLFLGSCFDDAQEPQPQPKSPPPGQQVNDTDLSS